MQNIDPFHHSSDAPYFEILPTLGWRIELPWPLTKFMVLELVVALLLIALYVPIARRARTGEVPRGKLHNFAEFLLTFIRDQVARPSLGKDADRFLPFLWTTFLFILFCNLIGMVPYLGTPTASLAVTGVLALIVFFLINFHGIARNGVAGYARSFVPHIDMDTTLLKILGPVLLVGMTAMEVLSLFIRSAVLAIRLFATMFAGHTVLFVLLLFIQMVGTAPFPGAELMFWPVTALSVGLSVVLSLLELFIAALQAFVFTFLTGVFLGMAMHPQH